MTKKFIPTKDQLRTVVDMANNGATKKEIGKYLDVGRHATERVICEYDIPYKRSQMRNVKWTDEMVQNLIRMHNSPQHTKKDIVEFLGLTDRHVTEKIKELGLKNAKKFHPSEDQVSHLRLMASQGKTRVEMANFLGVDRCVLPRLFKEHDITLKESVRNRAGTKIEWTKRKEDELKELYKSKQHNIIDIANRFSCSDGAIVRKAKELGISKVDTYPITLSDREYFANNYKTKTVEQMCKERRLSKYTVIWKMNKLGLTKEVPVHPKRKSMPHSEQFWNDYTNPNMSHVDVGLKYGIDRTAIGKWRRKDFGNDFKVMINTWLHKSFPEVSFEEILNGLKMTSEFQKRVDTWRFDYYLGFNLLVEIQSYWHENEKALERDSRKKKFAEDLGYEVIYFWEEDVINNKKLVEETVIREFHKAYSNHIAVHSSDVVDDHSVNL